MANGNGTYKYRIVERIARGAESVLYRAESPNGKTQYCVKRIRNWVGKIVLPVGRKSDKEKLEVSYDGKVKHLKNEFEVARKLEQSGDIPVVRVYALKRLDRFFKELGYDLLMEYLEGDDLGDRKAVRMLRLPDKISCFYQATLALQYMHQTGIAHLDMKPSNVMVTEGRVKLIDFGMSMPIGQVPRSLAGTVGYLSPEQIMREEIDTSTDLFALGVTFAVIFGGHPLRQTHDDLYSHEARVQAKVHLNSSDQPMVTDVPELRSVPELEALIRRCTVPKREARIRDAKTVATGIQRIAKDLGVPMAEPSYPL